MKPKKEMMVMIIMMTLSLVRIASGLTKFSGKIVDCTCISGHHESGGKNQGLSTL